MLSVTSLKHGPKFIHTSPIESRLYNCWTNIIQQKGGFATFQEFAFPGNVYFPVSRDRGT